VLCLYLEEGIIWYISTFNFEIRISMYTLNIQFSYIIFVGTYRKLRLVGILGELKCGRSHIREKIAPMSMMKLRTLG